MSIFNSRSNRFFISLWKIFITEMIEKFNINLLIEFLRANHLVYWIGFKNFIKFVFLCMI